MSREIAHRRTRRQPKAEEELASVPQAVCVVAGPPETVPQSPEGPTSVPERAA